MSVITWSIAALIYFVPASATARRSIHGCREFLRRYPDEFYIIGIEFISLVTIAGIIVPYSHGRTVSSYLFMLPLLLLIPVTQAAVELVNYFITSVLRPRPLPKLDFSEGVPADCKSARDGADAADQREANPAAGRGS